jgi:hypothetical protein
VRQSHGCLVGWFVGCRHQSGGGVAGIPITFESFYCDSTNNYDEEINRRKGNGRKKWVPTQKVHTKHFFVY